MLCNKNSRNFGSEFKCPIPLVIYLNVLQELNIPDVSESVQFHWPGVWGHLGSPITGYSISHITIPWFSKISNKCTYKYTHPTAGLAKYQNIYVQIYISSFPGWAKYQIYCKWWSTTHWVTQVCKECFGHLVLKANYTEQKVCPPEHWTVHELSICSTHMEVRYNTGKLCCPRHML